MWQWLGSSLNGGCSDATRAQVPFCTKSAPAHFGLRRQRWRFRQISHSHPLNVKLLYTKESSGSFFSWLEDKTELRSAARVMADRLRRALLAGCHGVLPAASRIVAALCCRAVAALCRWQWPCSVPRVLSIGVMVQGFSVCWNFQAQLPLFWQVTNWNHQTQEGKKDSAAVTTFPLQLLPELNVIVTRSKEQSWKLKHCVF